MHMHKQESTWKNDMHNIFWDFEKQKDPLIWARRPDLVIVGKKKNLLNSGLTTE